MEYWEFLLQKEGDRSWLPLESPDVEILEGRYRVVARSSRANTNIEIRITHQVADEMPPKRRAQKRFGRTNKDGLMVVFPFTRMKPGLWEIRCAGDLMSDFLGQSWQHSVCLQVLSQEFESDTDWEPEWEMQDEATSDMAGVQSGSSAIATIAEQPQADQPPIEAIPAIPAEVSSQAPIGISQPMPEATNYSVEQLQYLAERISESEASLLPDEDLEDAELENAAIASPHPEISETPKTPELASPADHVSVPAEFPAESAFGLPDAATPNLMESPAPENLPLQLVLAQSAYMTSWGHPFTLSGRLELREPENATTAIANPTAPVLLDHGELYICLSDPQNAQILVEVRQPLINQPLPYAFNCKLEIPLSCKTRLLLGEVAFYRPATDTESITQSFTLTADVDELLDAIAADLTEDQLLDLPLPTLAQPELESEPPEEGNSNVEDQESERAYLNLSFLNLAEPSPGKQPFYIQPSPGPLPPQIYRSHQAETPKTPALPIIQKFTPAPEEPAIAADTPELAPTEPERELEDFHLHDTLALVDIDSIDSDLGQIDLPHSEFADAELTDSEVSPEASSELADTAIDLEVEVDPPANEPTETEPLSIREELPEELNESVSLTSQALNFQGRFWARLSALAADADLSECLREEQTDSANDSDAANLTQPQSAINVTAITETTPLLGSAATPQSGEMMIHPTARAPEDQWTAQEIVVEDDRVEILPAAEPEPEVLHPALLHPDEAVPNPLLEVPTGELVSGKPVTVRVRMPDLPYRIYVKFWVNDRQTRSLLDGPRWLVDFTPTGMGDLEATTQLTVPFGSLEVQFEAIAIEMATQRESHKVIATRMVVPPDTPTLSFPEWD